MLEGINLLFGSFAAVITSAESGYYNTLRDRNIHRCANITTHIDRHGAHKLHPGVSSHLPGVLRSKWQHQANSVAL